MSVDSIGGNARDPNENVRQKKLQDERARDLKRMEERRKDEINNLQRNREEEIRDLGEGMERDIESKKIATQERLEMVKTAAESRIRDYENESARLTEEAKKQFQNKAQQLQKSALELQHQRDRLVKTHEDTMRELQDKAQATEASALARGTREAAKAHIEATKRINQISELGQAEAERVADEMTDAKRRAYNEGRAALERTKLEADENRIQIENQIVFDKRVGAEQVSRERELLEAARLNEQMKADDRLSKMSMDNQRNLSRTHSEGIRKFAEAQNLYHKQVSDTEREGRKKIVDLETKNNVAMAQISTEAEIQEQMARKAYQMQKEMLTQARAKNLDDASKANKALHEKLSAEYDARTQNIITQKEKSLAAMVELNEKEINAQRKFGRDQLNNLTAANAKSLATHDARERDPFYNLHKVNAQVSDSELETIVKLAVPEHEQDSVRITLQQGSLTVSGSRRSEAKAKLEDGHQAMSNSYQSYSESFAIKGRLLMSKMDRFYDNGVLTFRIPKG